MTTLEECTPHLRRAHAVELGGFQRLEARAYEPEGVPLVDGYTMHLGRYSDKPSREARMQAKRGPCIVAVCDGVIVGCARHGLSYVVPKHRGHGIGTRIYVELLQRWPDRAAAHYATGLNVTVAGEAMVRRALALVEGGQ